MDNGLWQLALCMLAFPLLYTGLISFRCRPGCSGGRGLGARGSGPSIPSTLSRGSSPLPLIPGWRGITLGGGPPWAETCCPPVPTGGRAPPCPHHPPWPECFVTARKEPEGHLGAPPWGRLAEPPLKPCVHGQQPHAGPRPPFSALWPVSLSGASRPRPHPVSAPRDRRLQAEGGLARIRAFFSAPVVVFHLNILSYFAFLCLFAYVLMVDFQPRPSGCECLIYLWLCSLVCEELRQVGPCPAPAPPTDPPAPGQLPGLGHFLPVALGPVPSPARLPGPLRAGSAPWKGRPAVQQPRRPLPLPHLAAPPQALLFA